MRDTELIRRARAGDKNAFGSLVERYQSAVYGYAYHKLGDFADAQDVAQEVFIVAYRQLAELREPGKFAGWLRGIAVNHCRRHLRARRQGMVSFEEELSPLEDGRPSPEERMEAEELRRSAVRLLERLSEKNRLAMTLRYLDDLSYEEIGRFLEVPVSTVKGRLHKARQKLAKEVTDMVKKSFAANRLDEEFTERVMKRGEQAGTIPLRTGEAIVLAGRLQAPVYATGRVLDAVSFAAGEVDPLAPAEVREQAGTPSGVRQFRIEILGQALDECVDQVRVYRREREAKAVFVKGDESWEAATLAEDAFDSLREDVVFRVAEGRDRLYARRGDDEFALVPSSAEEGDDSVLVLDIEGRESGD